MLAHTEIHGLLARELTVSIPVIAAIPDSCPARTAIFRFGQRPSFVKSVNTSLADACGARIQTGIKRQR